MAEMNLARDILGPILKGQQIAAQRRSARVSEIELEGKMANWESLAKHREAEATKWNRKKRELAGLDAAMQMSVYEDEKTGLPNIDSAKGMQYLIENDLGASVDEFMENVSGIRKDMADAVEAQGREDSAHIANAIRSHRNEKAAVASLNKVSWLGNNVVGYKQKATESGVVHVISKEGEEPIILTDEEADELLQSREDMVEEFKADTALARKNDELTTAQKEYEQVKNTWDGEFPDWLLLRDEYKAGRQFAITKFAFNRKDIDSKAEIVRTARMSNQTLGIMKELLPSTPVGKGQKMKLSLRKIAAAMGEFFPAFQLSDMQLANMQNQELFDLLSKNLAYSQRALYMPGQLSNQEGQILQSMVANIGNTRASAMLLIKLQIGFNEQIIRTDDAARALILKDGDMTGWYGDRGIRDRMWADFKKKQQGIVADYIEKPKDPLKPIWLIVPAIILALAFSSLTMFAPQSPATQKLIFLYGCGAGIWLSASVQIKFKNTWASGFVAIGSILIMLVAIGVITPTEMMENLKEIQK